MSTDRGSVPTGKDPEVPDWDDDEDENEIMAELRAVREQMLEEFHTDEALLRAVKAQEAELIKQGTPVVSLPSRRPPGATPNVA